MGSDGAAAMVSHVRLAILATMADGLYEIIQEQTWQGQSIGNGLAGRAVKEVQAKLRTLRFELEGFLGRTVLEHQHTLAWLVDAVHAAATINWHHTGVDGRTPFQRGESFR